MIRDAAKRSDRLVGEVSGRTVARFPPQRILFVCDATGTPKRTFAATLAMAKQHHAALRCVCIIQRLPVAADLIVESSLRHDEKMCRKMLADFDSIASKAHVRMDAEIVFGVPREQIAQQVREFDIDLLVLPTKRAGFAARTLQRSILRQAQLQTVIIMTVDDKGAALLAV